MNLHEAAQHFRCDKGPRQLLHGQPHGHGYTHVYQREFNRLFYDPMGLRTFALLEVGIQAGGSMQLWDWWLYAPAWIIVGLEINLDPAVKENLPKTFIHPERVFLEEGDSTGALTPGLRKHLQEKYGPKEGSPPFDVIIDDGSHWPQNQLATLRNLWSLVKPGGIYCIEDLHESWWPEHGPTEQMRGHGSIMPHLQVITEDCIGRGKFAEWSGVVPVDPVVKPQEELLFSVRYYRNMVVLEKRA